MLCIHYVLCGRRRQIYTWACSYQSPPSVVARRWERCGGWPRWPSGSRVRPWLPQRGRQTGLTHRYSVSLSSWSGSYFRPGKVFLGCNSTDVLFFPVSWQQREKASLVQPSSLESQLEGVAGQGKLDWLLKKMLCHCLFLAHQPMLRNTDDVPGGSSAFTISIIKTKWARPPDTSLLIILRLLTKH